jgi:hypothetical protein
VERAKKPPRERNAGGAAGLTGGGPSIVGVSGAMRARDVSRVRPEHDAAAERSVVIRRRPPDPEPAAEPAVAPAVEPSAAPAPGPDS